MRGALVYLGEGKKKKKRQIDLILREVLILPRLLNFLISSGFFVCSFCSFAFVCVCLPHLDTLWAMISNAKMPFSISPQLKQ